LNTRPQSEVLDHVESLDDDGDVLPLIHAPVMRISWLQLRPCL
jgi:hypothetical protein